MAEHKEKYNKCFQTKINGAQPRKRSSSEADFWNDSSAMKGLASCKMVKIKHDPKNNLGEKSDSLVSQARSWKKKNGEIGDFEFSFPHILEVVQDSMAEHKEKYNKCLQTNINGAQPCVHSYSEADFRNDSSALKGLASCKMVKIKHDPKNNLAEKIGSLVSQDRRIKKKNGKIGNFGLISFCHILAVIQDHATTVSNDKEFGLVWQNKEKNIINTCKRTQMEHIFMVKIKHDPKNNLAEKIGNLVSQDRRIKKKNGKIGNFGLISFCHILAVIRDHANMVSNVEE